MTPEQLAKMQDGRRAALAARQAEVDRAATDASYRLLKEHQEWQERHDMLSKDAAERRAKLWEAT